jgi:hypothetical protein
MLIRSTRRDIARVNTVLAERLRGEPVAPAARAAVVFEGAEAPAAEPEKAAVAKSAKATAKATKPKAAAKATTKATTKTAKET